MQQLRDMAVVAKDVWTRTGRAKDFIDQAGFQNSLAHYGRFFSESNAGKLADFERFVSWFNETLELWTRVSLRERVIKKGGTEREANLVAIEYLNYGQGGTVVKSLDQVFPYLNVAVQGLRNIPISAKNDPIGMAIKVMSMMATYAAVNAANWKTNPEGWAEVSPRAKVTGMVFMLPKSWGRVDLDGNFRHPYIWIPIDHTVSTVKAFVDVFMDFDKTGEVPPDEMLEAVRNTTGFFPGAGNIVPLADMILQARNFDFNTQRPVSPLAGRVLPEDEIRGPETGRETSRLAQDIGAALNISPLRLEGATHAIVTDQNPLSDMIAGGYNLLTEGQEQDVHDGVLGALMKLPVFRRLLRETFPLSGKDRDLIKVSQKEESRRIEIIRDGDRIVQRILAKELPESAIDDFANKQEGPDRRWVFDRMADEFQTRKIFEQIEGGRGKIPYMAPRQRWLNAAGRKPRAKAEWVAIQWDQAINNTFNSGRQMRAIRNIINNVDGFSGIEFHRVLKSETDRMGLPSL